VDGPLRGRAHLDRTVGYIKTHHASYLPGPQAAVVGALKPGQRTPAFTMGTSWERNSWYLQLPGTDGVPWSGVVRLECSADLEPKDVTRLADLTARVLPPFASTPYKDPRAPQNLVPIGGLERQLKHRLGDERLLYRALRAAAAAGATEHRALSPAVEPQRPRRRGRERGSAANAGVEGQRGSLAAVRAHDQHGVAGLVHGQVEAWRARGGELPCRGWLSA
jgi:hypothetical protein